METKEASQGNWNEFVGAVKRKYSQITGDDLTSVKGNIQQMAGVIQRKTGQAREEIEAFLKSVSSNSADAVGTASQVANEYLGKAGEGIREGYDYAVEATQEGYEAAKETIRQRPAEVVAIAFGIGLLTGAFVTLSMCKKS